MSVRILSVVALALSLSCASSAFGQVMTDTVGEMENETVVAGFVGASILERMDAMRPSATTFSVMISLAGLAVSGPSAPGLSQATGPQPSKMARAAFMNTSGANVGDAMDGPAISDEEHEVVLHEEEVVAEKRAVPKERVRLGKDTHVEEQQVSETVRREEIEIDDAGRRRS